MKNKRRLTIIIGIVTLCIGILIVTFITKNNNGYRTTSSLLKGLERAINNTDNKSIINCYPSFLQESIPELSNELIKEFHDKVGNISFNVIHENNVDSEEVLNEQNQINSKYNCNIKLEAYDLVICKYHEDFAETVLELIKINGRWYLYYDADLHEPLQYFVK